MADLVTELRVSAMPDTHVGDCMTRAADEIERLRQLVLIGDVRCERCGDPATTLDGQGDAACAACATQKEAKDDC